MCSHSNIGWPQNGTVQCHDCAQRLNYNWNAMRIETEPRFRLWNVLKTWMKGIFE